ncbi:MAG: hypothetical protein GF350_07685 [Chitinivibrionales bacterium]|nr:hypothetical protein [Chitinivibrionales bacterium]
MARIALSINSDNFIDTLDFSHRLMIVDISDGTVVREEYFEFDDSLITLRARKLKDMKIEIILCGAVSDPLFIMVWHSGIEVIPGLSGNCRDIVKSYITQKDDFYLVSGGAALFKGGCTMKNRGRFRNRGRKRYWR